MALFISVGNTIYFTNSIPMIVFGVLCIGGMPNQKIFSIGEELPVALAPSESYDKDGCFSGSAIVKDDKLYLLYTGHVDDEEKREETQCLAVSTDGITFEKLPTNPVIHAQHIEGDRRYCRFS